MSTPCSVCRLPTAGTINELLRDGRTARSVATEFALSYDALTRHARNHLDRLTTGAGAASADASNGHASVADPLDALVAALRGRALAGDPVVAREYRLALSAQAAASHAAAPTRDLATEPEWIRLRTALLSALEPFPAARIAVADALAAAGMD